MMTAALDQGRIYGHKRATNCGKVIRPPLMKDASHHNPGADAMIECCHGEQPNGRGLDNKRGSTLPHV